MNKTYKSIFNHHTQTWVAASEIVANKGKSSTKSKLLTVTLALVGSAFGTQVKADVYCVNNTLFDTFGSGSEVVCGDGAKASGTNSVAVGSSANASGNNSVALGANSVAVGTAVATPNVTLNGKVYNFQGANPVGIVSIGSENKERTLTNLAAGRINATSTDAVNGSQLYATNQAIQAIAAIPQSHYYSVNGNGVVDVNFDNSGATYEGVAAKGALAAGVNVKSAFKNATAVGSSLFAGGRNTAVVGYSSQVNVDRAWGFTPLIPTQPATGMQLQGMGAIAVGSYNTMGTSDVNAATNTNPAATLRFDALANAVTGTANTVKEGNGTLIYGAGNQVTNSIKPLDLQKISAAVPEVNTWFTAKAIASIFPTAANIAAADAAETAMVKALVTYTAKNEELGSMGIFGGGNTANNAVNSMITGIKNAYTNGEKSLISGYRNTLTNVNQSQVTGNDNILTGVSNTARAESNIVMGNRNAVQEAGKQNVIIGFDNATYDPTTGAVLTDTLGTGLEGNQIIGSNVTVANSVKDGVIIGRDGQLGANNTIAIGKGAQALGEQSISIGTGNKVLAARSGAIGDPTTIIASATDSYSIGNNNTVNTANTFVMGNNVTTTQANSVVLGKLSTDRAANPAANTQTVAGKTTTYAGTSSVANGVISVGGVGTERQIINVAPGMITATSTDAINGSQLYAVADSLMAS